MCNLINEILKAMNNKLIVGGTFCGLEKAFDSVSYNILLFKLEFYLLTIMPFINPTFKTVIREYLYTIRK
jgi:hypothetical protein